MAAIFFKWPPKWRIHWLDIFGSTFSKIYAPQIIDIESKSKALCLLVSETDVLLWKWPSCFKSPPKRRVQWRDVFSNTFSEIYTTENLYMESTMMAQRLLVSEI